MSGQLRGSAKTDCPAEYPSAEPILLAVAKRARSGFRSTLPVVWPNTPLDCGRASESWWMADSTSLALSAATVRRASASTCGPMRSRMSADGAQLRRPKMLEHLWVLRLKKRLRNRRRATCRSRGTCGAMSETVLQSGPRASRSFVFRRRQADWVPLRAGSGGGQLSGSV